MLTKLYVFINVHRPRQQANRDAGSTSVETAIIAGVVGAAALALTVAIGATITKYSGKLP